MTMSAISQICKPEIIGILAGLVVIETLVIIVQQVLIHTKGIKLQ